MLDKKIKNYMTLFIGFLINLYCTSPPLKPIVLKDGAQVGHVGFLSLRNYDSINLETYERKQNQRNLVLLDPSTNLGYSISGIYLGMRIPGYFFMAQIDLYLNPVRLGNYSMGCGSALNFHNWDIYCLNGISLNSFAIGFGAQYFKEIREFGSSESNYDFRLSKKDAGYNLWTQIEYHMNPKVSLILMLGLSKPFLSKLDGFWPEGIDAPSVPPLDSSNYIAFIGFGAYIYLTTK